MAVPKDDNFKQAVHSNDSGIYVKLKTKSWEMMKL
jgi:hypothetical protein